MHLARLRLLAAALLAVAVAGCDTAPTASQRVLVSSSPSAAAAPGSSALALGPCTGSSAPAGARCGTFSVPLDYSDASKGKIGLGVISVPARDPSRRLGSLLVNPGGPGASGVQFVEDALSLFVGLNERFDIVGFDPRGTGDPNPVACEDTAALDHIVGADPIIDDPAEKQDLVATTQQFAQACQQRSGRLLPYMGTSFVVRDMDGLRAALGDPKLNYLGFSYGTSIGSRYAAEFPTHIRAMALDGDIDPSLSLMDLTIQQADSLEVDYREFIRQCKAEPACPLGSDPDGAINRLLAALDAKPAALPDGRTVGRGEALTAVLASMYSASVWDQVYVVLAAAIQGNLVELQSLADSYTGRTQNGFNHQLEANAAVNCADYAMPTDLAAYDAVAQQTQARDPHFGEAAIYGGLACAYWPLHGPDAKALSVHGTPTILLVGGTHDPATPYAWSQALQKQIAGSVLLTRNGFGHVSYLPSRCVSSKVDAYLISLTVPTDGTICAS